MRLTLSALVVAAGLAGFGAAAQAAPVAPSALGASAGDAIVHVQMTHHERRMARRHMVRRMMRHERHMMRRHMRHERRMMHRM